MEGIDGSGKSTAIRHIAERLKEFLPGRRLLLTAEPSDSDAGRILRSQILRSTAAEPLPAEHMEELFLFMADHAHHLTQTIIPSLEEGAIVLCDRYADSTAAYQGVTLQGIVPDPVQWIREIYRPWNLTPDRTLLFLLDPEKSLQRISSRPGKEKFERLGFLRQVDGNFRRLASTEPERFVMVDASMGVEEVAKRATSSILERLRIR
jgi:dTMP kinase